MNSLNKAVTEENAYFLILNEILCIDEVSKFLKYLDWNLPQTLFSISLPHTFYCNLLDSEII